MTNIAFLPNGDAQSRLRFLVGFDENDCPVTEKHQSRLLYAKKWNVINNYSLSTGLVGCTALAVAPALLGINKVQDWVNDDTRHSSLLFIFVTIYAGAIGMINYVCTGTIPDKAAMASIKAAEVIAKTKQIYQDIACSLLDLYGANILEAKATAREINTQKIQAAMLPLIPNAAEICKPLVHAKRAVDHDQCPAEAPPVIRHQWENMHLKKRVEALESRIYTNQA